MRRSGEKLWLVAQWIVWLAAAGIALRVAWMLALQARAEYAFENSRHADWLDQAWRLDPQWRFAKARGDFYVLGSLASDPRRAATLRRQALLLNPYEATGWADWALARQRLGDQAAAERAFQQALRLNPGNCELQRKAGIFYLSVGESSLAMACHNKALALDASLLPSLVLLYWSHDFSFLDVARGLLPSRDARLAASYLQLAFDEGTPDQVMPLWEWISDQSDGLEPSCYVQYFSYLIRQLKYEEALRLWDEITGRFYPPDVGGEPANRLWNGCFEQKARINGGLEWMLSSRMPEGVRTRILSGPDVPPGQRGIRIEFDGRQNIHFQHVYHYFLLAPGDYRLTCRLNTFGLTTTNGVYIQIRLLGDTPRRIVGPAATGTESKTVSLDFTVSGGLTYGQVAICRDRSRKLNNRIAGQVQASQFRLEPVP